MRETRGVPSTPGASVTYDYDEQTSGELDITLQSGPKNDEINECVQYAQSLQPEKPTTAQNLVVSYMTAQNLDVVSTGMGLEATQGVTFEGPPTDWGWIMSASEIQPGVNCE